METPAKRARLSGSFTPLHSSTAPSTVSPTNDDATITMNADIPSTLTPMSDFRVALPEIPAIEESDVSETSDEEDDEDVDHEAEQSTIQGQNHNRIGENNPDDTNETSDTKDISDTIMSEVDDKSDKDWHLREATAHPSYIAKHLNQSINHFFKLNSTPPIKGLPHPSHNLVTLYGLDEVTTSVRRVDPSTGEKINKLRKSYEGKIKDLRISGRNKAVSSPNEWFPFLMQVPEEDWHNTFVHGKEVSRGLNPQHVKLACQILPGKLPTSEADKWNHILGLDDSTPAPKSSSNLPAPRANTTMGPPHSATTPNPATRPARVTAKRSYQDASFTGYGEGFIDDEDGTEDDNGARKRRKKESEFGVNGLSGQRPQFGVGVTAGGSRT